MSEVTSRKFTSVLPQNLSNSSPLSGATTNHVKSTSALAARPVRGEQPGRKTLETKTSVLLLGNYRPTLTLARTLSALGYNVIITLEPESVAQFSRFVDECWHSPSINDPPAFFEALGEFLRKRPDVSVVYPVLEVCLRHFARHAHLLPNDRLYVKTDDETIATCLSKPKMMALAAEVGVLCERHVEVSDYAALRAALQTIGFPLIVKPSNSSARMGTRKAVIASSDGELSAALPEWPEGHSDLIVQTYVDGPRINLYFAAQNGVPIRYLAAEILRTDEEDGTGLAVDGRTIELDAEIKSIGDRLLGRLEYHGIGCIQMLRDTRSGKYYFLELNPRIAGNHAVPEHCGLGLGPLAIELAQGAAADSNLRIGPAGKRYVWTSSAVYRTWTAARSGRIGWPAAVRRLAATIGAAAVADVHMNWHRRDPVPALAEIGKRLPFIRRVRKHYSKRLKRIVD
ncbi:hypothetical protein [Hyphomicrobium sp.]|uniref:ATP-binding protein n=1 Tax=Hyphomicrobium sp. TaxID=82 RepID=UPI002D79A13A|nr:hypothetical protein [Hyphomicrobium sp.]HET6387963.1 hypothetical protein [Hyphomicrobium sp.]